MMEVNREERTAILASLVNTRNRYVEAQKMEDEICDALNVVFDNIDCIEVTFEEAQVCKSEGSTLQEVITGYLNYGEGEVDKIVDLIVRKLEEIEC